jgi:hypothetical protein
VFRQGLLLFFETTNHNNHTEKKHTFIFLSFQNKQFSLLSLVSFKCNEVWAHVH